ncbi:MAG: 16S rRNA (guanine(966)-N(2))-methyltransferase RsmD [Deltaproteobacteria bacterium]|nr:16S rRNA (guanine(966)-N(2))-methyltransferase RsmD [Deltaproteobacteria bacterium]
MRIISGEARGRRLRAPRGAATRPTADRVREALFNILGSAEGLAVLDLFAGTGALALEALSRGAAQAVLVDHAEAAVRVIRANVATLGYHDRARVLRSDVLRALRLLGKQGLRFDLIFVDPPYDGPAALATLACLGDGSLLAPCALVVVEHDSRNRPLEQQGVLRLSQRRKYGQTEVSFYEAVGAAGQAQPSE